MTTTATPPMILKAVSQGQDCLRKKRKRSCRLKYEERRRTATICRI